MKKPIIVGILLVVAAFGCKKETDSKFLITNNNVGDLYRISLARELPLIYENDSIVKDTSSANLSNSAKKVRIFEKGGKHLLTLTPSSDSIPKIENVKIEDPRYVTDKGLSLNSTFKDIKERYTIRKIITSLNNVVILLKDSDLYITIDKNELPSSLRYASSTNIEAVQIPDGAKIKYLMIGWN